MSCRAQAGRDNRDDRDGFFDTAAGVQNIVAVVAVVALCRLFLRLIPQNDLPRAVSMHTLVVDVYIMHAIHVYTMRYICVSYKAKKNAGYIKALLPENMSRETTHEPFRSPIAEIKNNSLHPLVKKTRKCLGFSLKLNNRR